MKILHLIYSEAVSGAEKYIKQLLPGLNQYNINCHLIIVSPKSTAPAFYNYCEVLNRQGVTTTLIEANRGSLFFTAKKISSYLKANKIDIVHSHLLNSDIIAVAVKLFFFKKLYLISSKHGYQEKILQQYEPGKKIKLNDLYYHITKFTLRHINQNLSVSNAIAEMYINLGFTKEKFPVIHHGVTIAGVGKDENAANCRKVNPQLIIVGRLELIKGHSYLLKALPEVLTVFPTTGLLIIGEGTEKANLINEVNRLGLKDRVTFMGFQSHPYSYIAHSDIAVLPSLFEPFGLVYIEAFALQTSVVAFDTAAGNEIMDNGITALLVPKANSNQLAQKIIYLLTHANERKKMEERAYEKYKQSFTAEVMIKNTANWYRSLKI